MVKISLEELTKIAREIESTPPKERGNISEVEYAWLYSSGRPLQRLKENTSPIAQFLMIDKSSIIFEDYRGTKAKAHIHNHPSGNIQPSFEDVQVLLGGVYRGKNLTHALIASTKSGYVGGFYEMEFQGKRTKVAALRKRVEDIYREHITKKYDYLHKHPEITRNMKIGDDLLSPEEYWQMTSEAMSSSSIVGMARPLRDYRFNNWIFIPIKNG